MRAHHARPLPALIFALLIGGAHADPLPSWNDGPAKNRIVGFVTAAAAKGGTGYISPDERIAVFDNDGTLWAEHPLYFQFMFVLDRSKALARRHPEWRTQQPFKADLDDNLAALSTDQKDLMQLLEATHAGMTTDAFAATVT